MDLLKSMSIAASGMRAQSQRVRVVAENLANANSLALVPGGDPYRRQVVTFRNELDRNLGATVVKVNRVLRDPSDFGTRYDPAHPAADDDGYVKTPNVNTLVEMMDIREAQRSYEANLAVIENAKAMLARTVALLQG